MQTALRGVPVAQLPEPPGLVHVDGELYFDDYAPGRGVASLGLEPEAAPQPVEVLTGVPIGAPPQPEERNRILDFFR
jgi:penicillin-binding protein 1A